MWLYHSAQKWVMLNAIFLESLGLLGSLGVGSAVHHTAHVCGGWPFFFIGWCPEKSLICCIDNQPVLAEIGRFFTVVSLCREMSHAASFEKADTADRKFTSWGLRWYQWGNERLFSNVKAPSFCLEEISRKASDMIILESHSSHFHFQPVPSVF